MMRSLTFDPGKMHIFVFQLTINLLYKKILKTLYVINAYMFKAYLWKFHKRTCKFFQVKIIQIFIVVLFFDLKPLLYIYI